MTHQFGEVLFYKGKENEIAEEPLYTYLKNRKYIQFVVNSTACWRGYYGVWKIEDYRLYLIKFEAYIEEYQEVDLSYLFPGQEEVFAEWFSGVIKIPISDFKEYGNIGIEFFNEKELSLKFIKGILIKESEVCNSIEIK